MNSGVTVRHLNQMKAQVSTVKQACPERGRRINDVLSHTSIAALRRHPQFTAAKAGDPIAAFAVVRELTRQERITRLASEHPGAIICPVLAIERTGINMLPLAFAKFAGSVGGLRVETEIVQINKTHHTDSDAMHRLLNRPEFDGIVIPGQAYIVVDDVITSGSTIQALRLFLESHGAKVVAFAALAGSFNIITGSSLEITLTEETLHGLETKFGIANFTQFLRQHHIAQAPAELTNCQARYLLSFRNLDSIRNRIAPQHSQVSIEKTRSTSHRQMMLAFA